MAQLVVEVTERGIAQTEQKLSKLGQTADKTSRSTDNVSKSNQKLSQTANQVGFQLQDLVVQLQAGTSAFTAIGQQGSQLASVFNPLVGLAVALGSAIAGIAFNAANATQDLSALEAAGRRKGLPARQGRFRNMCRLPQSPALSESGRAHREGRALSCNGCGRRIAFGSRRPGPLP